jgi:hypothetical protein
MYAFSILQHQIPEAEQGWVFGDAILEPFLRQLRMPAKKNSFGLDVA